MGCTLSRPLKRNVKRRRSTRRASILFLSIPLPCALRQADAVLQGIPTTTTPLTQLEISLSPPYAENNPQTAYVTLSCGARKVPRTSRQELLFFVSQTTKHHHHHHHHHHFNQTTITTPATSNPTPVAFRRYQATEPSRNVSII